MKPHSQFMPDNLTAIRPHKPGLFRLTSLLVVLCFGLDENSTLWAQASTAPSKEIAASVRPFVEREELAGAVMLVANKDGILALEAVGWADVATRKPMRTNSIFWIASQSKPITAAALMLLVEAGKIALD